MNKRILPFLGISLLVVMLISCKKDNDTSGTPSNTETLEAASQGGAVVSTQMQTFMISSITVAADSGHIFFFPEGGGHMLLKSHAALEDFSWTGPDADGWYSRYYSSGGYNYYEKLHLGDTISYILDMSYSGGDGSFENKTTTKYFKKIKNGITLYDGYSIWEIHNSGYNDISRWEWRICFNDWNPATSAGTYDWYWGLYENSGGSTIPYHRFEHLEATETTPDGWLHCHVIFYDDSGSETWDFEYDTPCSPVEMPQVPGWN